MGSVIRSSLTFSLIHSNLLIIHFSSSPFLFTL
jgi:hypothetical protein